MSLDAIIADIKERLPLVEYVQRDVKLTKSGTAHQGPCPFHGEKKGSFTVWPKIDAFRCFGCGKTGDLFTYYQLKHNVDFKDALHELAREAGVELRESPEQAEAAKQLRERSEILARAVEFYHTQLQPEHREYLHKRGFTDEFIDAYQFGYAAGGCIGQALTEVPGARLREIGLLSERDGRLLDFFLRRIVIPVYRAFGRDNTVVNLVGRAYPPDADVTRKYMRLPGPEQLINEGALRGATEVWLCEGDTDTPTLLQAGLCAVGVPGSTSLKEEWIEKFAKAQTIYCCADADDGGEKLVHRAGELFGVRARIVDLPAGEDVNSYVGQQGNDVTLLAKSARPYLEWLLARLPSELPPDQADVVLEPAFLALSRYKKASQDLYAKQIAKRFGLNVASLREAIREREQKAKNGHDKDGKLADSKIIWQMPRMVNPAQDLVDGTMLTAVFLDAVEEDEETKKEKIVTKPWIVTSKRELFPLTEPEMWRHNWRFLKTKVPAHGVIGQRWSTSETAEYSVKSYLDNKATVTPFDVYQDVVKIFRDFVDYPNDLYYDFLALWVMATYWFNLFPAFPYVHLLGFKRVGKSRTLNLISELAFNALWSASMTAAAAYRTVEMCSGTLLMDEAENFRKKDKNDKSDRGDDDKLEILKAGYQRGQRAIRCSGDNNEPTGYDLYSPKAFGGTQSLDRILGDRVIALILARRGRELQEFKPTELADRFAAIRDKLYILMLDYGANVAGELHEGIHWGGVQDREAELWTPLLVVAQMIDKSRLEGEADLQSVDKETLLTHKMRTLAKIKVAERVAREQAEQSEVMLFEGLLDYINRVQPVTSIHPGTYSSGGLLHHIQQVEGLDWIKSVRMLIQQLEKMTVIRDRQMELPRLKVGGNFVRCVKLDKVRIEDLAARYGANTNGNNNETS